MKICVLIVYLGIEMDWSNVVVLCGSGHWLTEVWLPELSFLASLFSSNYPNVHKYFLQLFFKSPFILEYHIQLCVMKMNDDSRQHLLLIYHNLEIPDKQESQSGNMTWLPHGNWSSVKVHRNIKNIRKQCNVM